MTKNRYDKRKKEESIKIYKVFICIMMLIAFTGCSDSKSTTSEPSPTEESGSQVEVDKGLLNVEITIGADMLETFDETAEEFKASLEENEEVDFKDVTINEDGSVTFKMSKSDHNKMMDEMLKSIDSSIAEITQNKEDYPNVIDITHDKDLLNWKIKMSSTEQNISESFLCFGLAIQSIFYHGFNGDKQADVVVDYVDEDGNVFDTWSSKALEEENEDSGDTSLSEN